MDNVDCTPEPRDISPLQTKVITFQEAIYWIAHANFAGTCLGVRSLIEFCNTDHSFECHSFEVSGREQLAFDLLWVRMERGEVRVFGRKAELVQDEEKAELVQDEEGDPVPMHWGEPRRDPEPIPPELIAAASWTEDEYGGIEGELASYWGVTVHHDDLMRWFPARGPVGQEKAASGLRNRLFEAAGHHPPAQGRSTASTESKCRKWIAKLAAEGVSPRSRDDLFTQALAQFPTGLSRRGFDRCWDEIAPDRWKRAGRKPRQDYAEVVQPIPPP
jgi:hypothetical protein